MRVGGGRGQVGGGGEGGGGVGGGGEGRGRSCIVRRSGRNEQMVGTV
jgi:hypothetical protein